MRLLLVKTSSLGDIVHTLAPLTDAARAIPGLRCDWLIEEAYRDIATWHPAVQRVIPCALRRWRRAPGRTLASGEWRRFRAGLRQESYDLVLDAQGLLKSAWLARQARGPRAGRTFGSAREGLASLTYDFRIPVDVGRSEVEQLRQLFALALGYETPAAPADFGLDRARFGAASESPYLVFLHAAAWPSKLWPEAHWQALGREAQARRLRVLLPWGNDAERSAAQRIADACGGEVLPKLGIAELAAKIAGARCVVGLDTGLTHLAVALAVPTLTLYGPTIPVFGRVARGERVDLCSTDSKVVDTARPNTVPLEKAREALARWL
jgi:heptosyltransferase I